MPCWTVKKGMYWLRSHLRSHLRMQAQYSPRYGSSQASQFHPSQRAPYMPPSLSSLIPPPAQTQPLRPEPYRASLPPPVAHPHQEQPQGSVPAAPQAAPYSWPPTPHSPQGSPNPQRQTHPESEGPAMQQPFGSSQSRLRAQVHSDLSLHQTYSVGQSQSHGTAMHHSQGSSMQLPYGSHPTQHTRDHAQVTGAEAGAHAPSLQQTELYSTNPRSPRTFVVPHAYVSDGSQAQTQQAQQAQRVEAPQWGSQAPQLCEERSSTHLSAVQHSYRYSPTLMSSQGTHTPTQNVCKLPAVQHSYRYSHTLMSPQDYIHTHTHTMCASCLIPGHILWWLCPLSGPDHCS